MKKLLISILTVLGVGLSFCSAEEWIFPDMARPSYYIDFATSNYNKFIINSSYSSISVDSVCVLLSDESKGIYNSTVFNNLYGVLGTSSSDYVFSSSVNLYTSGDISVPLSSTYYFACFNFSDYIVPNNTVLSFGIHSDSNKNDSSLTYTINQWGFGLVSVKSYPYGQSGGFYLYNTGEISIGIGSYNYSSIYGLKYSQGSSCPDPDPQEITIHYNNNQSSTTISCDGNPDLYINGLSTITSTNTFTPYYNISYKDQDNQLLIESYDHNILYLENAQFKKTYTGNNDWILTVQGGNNSNFSGYLPTFDVVFTGDSLDTGNIFNNFAENSLKFTLSNIPSYIQYVIIIMLLFFILGFIRKFKRK